MSDKNAVRTVSLCDLLLVTFIVLKLTGAITWSWLWVLAPLWSPFILCLIIVLVLKYRT